MADLGAFGPALAEVEDDTEQHTFTVAGQQFDVVSPVPGFVVLEYITAVNRSDKAPNAILYAVMEFLEAVVAKKDWIRFRAACTDSRLNASHLQALVSAILTGSAGRPTKPSSDSPTGQSSPGTSSKGVRSAAPSQQDEQVPAA